MDFSRYFSQLADWKCLPAYKAETRIDSEAQSAGVAAIVAGIERIAQVSTYKQKYGHLLAKLQNYGLQSSTVDGRRFEIVYVQPANSKAETQVVDFLWMANWLEARPDDAFGREFAKALRSWAND